jgi:hypothetical protein
MRKDEEFITNKKRFYDEFSDKNVEKKEVKPEKIDIISSGMIFSLESRFLFKVLLFMFRGI